MTSVIQTLREKREALLHDAEVLSELADTENRELAEDEQKRFTDNLAEAKKLADKIIQKQQLSDAHEMIPIERKTEPPKPGMEHTSQNPGLEVKTIGGPRHYRHSTLKSFKGPNAEDNAFRSGQFLRALFFGDEPARVWCLNNGIKNLAAGEAINTAGGVLVPDEFEAAIIDLREVYGVFRRECMVTPMVRDVKNVPRRTGGLTAYFVGENPGSGITTSDKAWDMVKLVAKKLATLSLMSNEIAEDAVINLADDLASEIAYAFSLKEDQCGFLGDATSTYGGITGAAIKINDGNHAAGIFTAASGHTAYSTLTLADFNGLTGTLPEFARGNARWFCHRVAFANSMERLMYAGGGNTVDTIRGGDSLQFLGYPVVISQVLNSTTGAQTSTIVILFGDLRMAATMGNRRGVSVARSDERYFEFDQIGIRGIERLDINVHDLGDGTNAGPLVALKTAAS